MEEIRTFIAVELSDNVKQALREAQKQLKNAPGASAVRWVAPENMHLTLKFLGNVSRTRIDELAGALTEAVVGTAPFVLTAEGLGCFPNIRRPNVVWVGLAGDVTRLVALAGRIEDALAGRGIAREDRPFSPHLTLGRVNHDAHPSDRAALGDAIQKFPRALYGTTPVAAVHLVQSDLTPSGSVYTILRTAQLRDQS
ncbi:MAG: RNA 2',3'-cyclic phosphodiesterase [Anaerolineae bacterium]